MTSRHAEWLVVVFFAAIIVLVFQQIATSMTEQGIASGGPYDDAAAYPRAVAVAVGVVVALITLVNWFSVAPPRSVALVDLKRPAALVLTFAVYLWALDFLGYHLATAPMLAALMLLGGLRKPLEIIGVSIGVAFGLAWFFEVLLKIVLPGGIFALNIAW